MPLTEIHAAAKWLAALGDEIQVVSSRRNTSAICDPNGIMPAALPA